jgi:hypothetical protein
MPACSICEGLSEEDREELEELLARLLEDLNNGTLDKDDLVTLAAICAALSESQLVSLSVTLNPQSGVCAINPRRYKVILTYPAPSSVFVK